MITEQEKQERNRLMQLQSKRDRWFTREEFDRLQELSRKLFENAGDPTTVDGKGIN